MRLVAELKRRNVFRMAVFYAVVAWLIVQVIQVLSDIAKLPDWIGITALWLLVVGFPFALIFSWFYEITPGGISLEKDVDRSDSITHVTGRRLDFLVISLLCAAVVLFAYDKWWPQVSLEKSIAVLPFDNHSTNAEDAYFTAGVHSDIVTLLTKLSSLDKVISRTSTEQYRETSVSIPQIGQELDVATILIGVVQRSGDQVRIIVQLIDAATEVILWANTYDRPLTAENLFAIQSEISREIVTTLHGVLSDEESEQLQRIPTASLEAYAELVLGRQEMAKRTGDAVIRAQAHFEKAIYIDPDFAIAYVGLAESHALKVAYAGVPMETTFVPRQEAIDKALSLDPLAGEAYASLAQLRRNQNKNDEAEKYYLRAIGLSPNSVLAHQWYSSYLRTTGRFDEALLRIRKAVDLDPMSLVLIAGVAMDLQALGRYEEAKMALFDSVKRNPEFPPYYAVMADILLNEGHIGEALKWQRVATKANPMMLLNRMTECWLYIDLADDLSAEGCFDSLEEDLPNVALGSKLPLYEFRADRDETVALLDELADGAANSNVKYFLADYFFYAGEWSKARSIFEDFHPGPFVDDEWAPGPFGLRWTVMAACILYADADADADLSRANYLFDQSLKTMQSRHRTRGPGFAILDVLIHVVRGDKKKAISSLREAVDTGWRSSWWRLSTPVFDSMLDEPEWISLVSEIEADIARQRQWYEEHKEDALF